MRQPIVVHSKCDNPNSKATSKTQSAGKEPDCATHTCRQPLKPGLSSKPTSQAREKKGEATTWSSGQASNDAKMKIIISAINISSSCRNVRIGQNYQASMFMTKAPHSRDQKRNRTTVTVEVPGNKNKWNHDNQTATVVNYDWEPLRF